MREVLRQHEGPLVRYAVRLTGNLETARNVVQDALVRLCREKPERLNSHLAEWFCSPSAVTALYEIVPAAERRRGGSLMTVNLRYKEPDAGKSQLLTAAVQDEDTSWRRASDEFRFAAAVACFGMVLRGSEYRSDASLDLALELAGNARGRDKKGQEFVALVRRARELGGSAEQ
jgi:DNA-directed RNA polymerase specialized sigma24 family protein